MYIPGNIVSGTVIISYSDRWLQDCYHGEYSVGHIGVKSLCRTSETNTRPHAKYTLMSFLEHLSELRNVSP